MNYSNLFNDVYLEEENSMILYFRNARVISKLNESQNIHNKLCTTLKRSIK